MEKLNIIQSKILDKTSLAYHLRRWRLQDKKIVFTNGCFDILHKGHIVLLSEAASFGNVLVVGLNSDSSVKKLKGEGRPVNNEADRALLLASLLFVDAVILFEEDTPAQLIKNILPDVLVKGGDYNIENVVGADTVIHHGGKVAIIPTVPGYATTSLINNFHK